MIIGLLFFGFIFLMIVSDLFTTKEQKEKQERKMEEWRQDRKERKRQKIIEEELIRQEVRDKLKEEKTIGLI